MVAGEIVAVARRDGSSHDVLSRSVLAEHVEVDRVEVVEVGAEVPRHGKCFQKDLRQHDG